MSYEDSERAFEFGYRTITSIKYSVRGLGLGLTVARSIARDFYGDVWIDKARNPTVFSIFLPDKIKNNDYIKEIDWIK